MIMQSTCEEYQCPCHDKLEKILSILRSGAVTDETLDYILEKVEE